MKYTYHVWCVLMFQIRSVGESTLRHENGTECGISKLHLGTGPPTSREPLLPARAPPRRSGRFPPFGLSRRVVRPLSRESGSWSEEAAIVVGICRQTTTTVSYDKQKELETPRPLTIDSRRDGRGH